MQWQSIRNLKKTKNKKLPSVRLKVNHGNRDSKLHHSIGFKICLSLHINPWMVLLDTVSQNCFNSYEPPLSLRSADKLLLVALKTSLKLWGDQTFAAAAPKLWNKLRHWLCLNRCLKANSFLGAFDTVWHVVFYCLLLLPNCFYLWFKFFCTFILICLFFAHGLRLLMFLFVQLGCLCWFYKCFKNTLGLGCFSFTNITDDKNTSQRKYS